MSLEENKGSQEYRENFPKNNKTRILSGVMSTGMVATCTAEVLHTTS